jgi:RHS repeat-associated protein
MTLVRGDGTTAWYAADVNTKTAILATEGAADSLWRTGTAIGGHDQAYLASNAGMRSQTATRRLTLANLAAGQTYQLFATWTADGDRATNAAYTVSGARPVSGVGTTTTILVNQRYVPGELDAHGVQWRSLGFFHVASGSTITIDVATSYPTATGQTAFADGFVVADAVMAVQNWTFTTPAGSFNQLDAGPLDDTNGFYAGPGGNAPAAGDFTLLAKTGTRYRFDAQGLLQRTTDRNENRVEFAYADKDTDGVADEVETITTQGGLRWTYGYANKSLSAIEDFAGRMTSVAVVGHNLQSITEPDPGANQPGGIVTTFTYAGPAQRLDTVTDPESRETKLTFGTGDRVSGGTYTGGITLALAAYLTDGLDGTLHAPATGKIGAAAPPAGSRPEPQAVYTDPRTAVWTYQADRFGLSTAEAAPVTKSRPQQDVWLWARNTHGLVIEATEPAGAGGFGGPLPALVTKYDYDGRGNRVSVTYPQAKLAGGGPITESWTYSQTFSVLTSATDGRGNTTTYVLDARGNTEEIRAPESRTSYFEYTPAPAAISDLQGGLVIKATDPRGSLVVTDYFQPSDKKGQATLSGLVKQVTAGILDANAVRIHGLTAKPTDKTVQTFTYDPQRNPESRTQKMDGVGPDRKTSYVYDLLDRLVTVTAPEAIQVQPSGTVSGSPETPITKYTYDRVGRLTKTVDPLLRTTTTTYDDAARKETLELPAAPQVVGVSPGLGTITARPTTITLRDTSGNVVSVTDANLNKTSYAYDARNQLETKTLPSISGLGPSVFTYTYDSVGNLASETLPATNIAAGTADRKTTFRYDAVHRLTLETRPTPGGVSTHVAPLTAVTYDDAGNKASVTDPMQRVTQYAYDAANRLITVTAPAVETGGQPTVTTYDYDRSDNLAKVMDAKNGDWDVVSIYDPLNRKIRDTFVTVNHFNADKISSPISAAAWMEYAYNDAGEVIQTTDRLGRTTDREYDPLGRLTKVIQSAAVDGGPRPTTVMQYDAVGNLRLVYDPLQSQALSALSRTEYEYDALDRRVVVRSAAPGGTGGTVRPEVKTGYDPVGNVRTVTDPRGNLTRTDYNAQNLPTLVMQPDPGPGPGGTAADHPPVLTAFTYDPAGNRIETVATSLGMDYKTSTTFDNLDRPYQVTDRTNLVTLTAYLADGLVESTTQASGTAESRTTNYDYDGLARKRIERRQRVGGEYDVTTTTYDAVGNLVSLTDPAGNVTEFSYDRAYRKTGDATLARLQPTGSPQLVSRSYQYDKQNNLRLVTDRNGRQTQYDYDGLDRRTTERWLGATGNGYVATFAYDLAGNLKSADDQYGTTPYSSVGYDLDGLYRTTKVTTTLPGVAPTTAPSRFDSEVGSTYDVAGNRTGSTVAVNGVTDLSTSYGFDNLDRTTSIRQSGPTIFARGVNFDYHADGRVKGTTRFSGNTAGGIFGITIANSFLTGTSVSKFHATNGRLESLTHADSAGKAEVEYTFTYDALDRIKTYRENRPQVRDIANQPIPAFERPYDYDLTDQTTQAGGQETFFTANGTRTGGGYLTDRDNRLALDPSFVYTYDAEGNRVSRTALAASAAGRVQAVDDSPMPTGGSWNVSAAGYGGSQQVGTGFLSSSAATATWQTPALPAGAYEVYATWAPLSAGLQTERYTLTTSDGSGALASTTSQPINFRQAPAGLDYDGVQWTRIGGVSSTGIFTATVTLSTSSNWTGEIPADAILVRPVSLEQAKTTYQWDHQNRLTSVTNHSATIAADGSVSFTLADTTTYAYDVLGRRAAVTFDKTDPNDTSGEFHRVSIHDGSQVVWTEQGDNRDQMATSTSTQAMLWAPGTDQLLAIQEQRGPGDIRLPVWTLTDQQGTVKDYLAKGTTTGAESGLIVTRRFSAFGTPELAKLWISGPDGNFTDVGGNSGFFYVGQEYDATTGLQYSRARYYDPVSSEFISQDPLGFAGGDTNLYRRAGNQSVSARPRERYWSEWAWDNLTYDSFSMAVHSGLAATGAIPGAGIIPDAIDLVYTLAEMPFGKSTSTDLALATAGIAATAVPVGGDQAAAAVKIAARAARVATQAASAVGTAAMAAARPIARGVAHSAGALPASVRRFVDEAIGAGKNVVAPVSGASKLVHLTNEAGDIGIAATGAIRGSHGIFAVPAHVARESTVLKVLRTGLTPGKTTNAVPIPDEALALFKRPIPIGPYSGWKFFGGVRYAPSGSLSTATGTLTRTSSLVGPKVLIYGPDGVFYVGIATAAGLYIYAQTGGGE